MGISNRQYELTELLDKAARAYEQEKDEIMSNFEYDRLYDELKKLEEESGTVLSKSPTAHAGYEVLSELPKFKHETPCLSLDKTKSVDDLSSWLGNKEGLISWKMDGLTVVLTYRNGELYRAVTRGNGEIGEIITNNAKVFKNVPLKISYKGSLVIRGEAVIKYSDFYKINEQIENPDERYKNPRNLCSGSVRQLNNEITAKRNVHFFAFSLTSAIDENGLEKEFVYRLEQLEFLEKLGFTVVEHKSTDAKKIYDDVKYFSEKITENDFPSDGLVLLYNDIAYGKSLGRTAKFPRDSIAFKWQDETAQTRLLKVEWSASRTGLINPVAVFEPVELEGTTVKRASVHNVSVLQELELGIGDEILIYKANMIIPQIAENKTKSGSLEIPSTCPVCGGKTEIRNTAGAKSLFCTNPKCMAKKLKSLAHFVSRDAMNIEGLSEATMEKLIAKGFIHEYADLFKLPEHRDEIIEMEGFGEKSFENLITSCNNAKKVNMANFIYALGISNVGLSNAKLICRHFDNDWHKIINSSADELVEIDGIGDVIADSFVNYFADEENCHIVDDCLKLVEFQNEEPIGASLDGIVFVITGSLNKYTNRSELKNYIESNGGKVASAVSGNTNFLINNDVTSNSSKNKKAKELGIEIISEETFIDRFTK